MKSSITFFALVLLTAVSAQTDSCGPQPNFVELLHEVIEGKINSTLRDDLRLLVEREVRHLVDGAIDQRIEWKVNRTLSVELETRANETIKHALASEPGKLVLYLYFRCMRYYVILLFSIVIRTIRLNINPGSGVSINVLYSGQRASISLSNPSRPATSSNKLLAYRPRYSAAHQSGVGAIFLNIEAIFPCMNSSPHPPVCGRMTSEEDGFFRGRPFIEAADNGNNFQIFSTTEGIKTYGIAVKGCAELNANCWPGRHAQTSIVCLLPRDLCG